MMHLSTFWAFAFTPSAPLCATCSLDELAGMNAKPLRLGIFLRQSSEELKIEISALRYLFLILFI